MLKRKNAEADYTDSVRKEAKERFENYTKEQLNQLQNQYSDGNSRRKEY